MKLSTRSRYGTRMMVDLAEHYDEGPIRMGDIAKRQDISVKYLEQLIIPLKKAQMIKSVRGPRGGHMLARPPRKISVGEIVSALEKDASLTRCVETPEICDKSEDCRTRGIWKRITRAMHDELESVTLSDLVLNSSS
jgi:Rrf2 family iron-sulfur cluster assembly transcriptional regulator